MTANLPEAMRACAELSRTHYENFPVRSPLLRRDERDDLAAIYAYCRTTDDLGDEWRGDRLAALDAWEAGVRATLDGAPPGDQPALVALAPVIERRGIGADPFLRIIEANRRDQIVRRYESDSQLLDYCRHSATPVGRMVLAVIGATDEAAERRSDATCIGLQLANFWQDIARDRAQDRCYLPLDACRRFGVDPDRDLDAPSASPALRALIEERVGVARSWLRQGIPLADALPLRWRSIVRAFGRGGLAVCDALETQEFDPLSRRPTISAARRRVILATEIVRAPFRNRR